MLYINYLQPEANKIILATHITKLIIMNYLKNLQFCPLIIKIFISKNIADLI